MVPHGKPAVNGALLGLGSIVDLGYLDFDLQPVRLRCLDHHHLDLRHPRAFHPVSFSALAFVE